MSSHIWIFLAVSGEIILLGRNIPNINQVSIFNGFPHLKRFVSLLKNMSH